jgi:dTDP-L-rhamnose 4-epimerase
LKVLVTGGAGFIGTHLTKKLLSQGYEVRILDNFSEQIHGNNKELSSDIKKAELLIGDIRDKESIKSALEGINIIVHLAAETGTGQSMYEIERYETTNVLGTLNLIEYLLKNNTQVEKFVIASSRAIYGEGSYMCDKDGKVFPQERLDQDMLQGNFEPRCPVCSNFLLPCPTSERSPLNPLSYYALTKQTQEQMLLMYAKILGISGYALRYQNVYGPGQSLKNPYTGILAIFSTLARQGKPIRIFEDGLESRDFVYIDDIVEATFSCIDPRQKGIESLNVGTGLPTSVIDVSKEILNYFNSDSELKITGEYRAGDIRHNFADVKKIKETLSFESDWSFKSGLYNFLDWASDEPIPDLEFEESLKELSKKGLFKKSKLD